MKYPNNEQLQGTKKGKSTLRTTRKVSNGKSIGETAFCKGSSLAVTYSKSNATDRAVKSQGSCMRSVRGSTLSYVADMTAVFNREGDETIRAMNTITNMRFNQAKVAEKYKDI